MTDEAKKAPAALPRVIVPIIEPKVQDGSVARNIWRATPDQATPFEDLLRPEFWAHVAYKMQPTDRIEVNAEDSSYFAELIVIDAARQWAKVALLRKVDLGKQEVAGIEAGEFKVEWNVGGRCYRVIRKLDRVVLQDNLKTKNDGMLWIANHNRDLAA